MVCHSEGTERPKNLGGGEGELRECLNEERNEEVGMTPCRKVGILGGTFDPPHMAHLVVAQEALERLFLDRVIFLPAFVPPHKTNVQMTPFDTRLAMVHAAIKDNPRFEVWDLERTMTPPSYTVRTLYVLREDHPEWKEIFLIVGSDALLELESWKDPDEILRLCSLVVFPRPEYPIEHAPIVFRSQSTLLRIPPLPISSTYLRERVGGGHSIRYWVHDRVADIVEQEELYGAAAGEATQGGMNCAPQGKACIYSTGPPWPIEHSTA